MNRVPHAAYTLGVDFGSNSARALLVDLGTGFEVAQAVCNYPSGNLGIFGSDSNTHLARQHPSDYLTALTQAVTQALAAAKSKRSDFDYAQVLAIGVDTTGSTPIPLDSEGQALCWQPAFANNLNALAWLWKDHTAYEEAEQITAQGPVKWLARVGGRYSSEWYWAKIWQCARLDPAVAQAAADWVELADWVPAVLTASTRQVIRGLCAAGHKAFYAPDLGGLPPRELFESWHPLLARQHDVLSRSRFQGSDRAVGRLSPQWQSQLGLADHVIVATGAFDAHLGAIGAGVALGTLVKVIGTSTCDVSVAQLSPFPEIPGVCGVVNGSVVPGYAGIEAGQSAVGDLLAWWVRVSQSGHTSSVEAASRLRAGQSGLMALDWNNGNRTVLVDQRLSGLLLGQTLSTSATDIYRALIEATAFGARCIVERIEVHGVPIDRVIACGGIADKNPLFMQIYANVLGRPVDIAGSDQTCALGSAIAAAVACKAFPDFSSAQQIMVPSPARSYLPDPEEQATYNQLFALYSQLHDAFGNVNTANMGQIMKQLLTLAEQCKPVNAS